MCVQERNPGGGGFENLNSPLRCILRFTNCQNSRGTGQGAEIFSSKYFFAMRIFQIIVFVVRPSSSTPPPTFLQRPRPKKIFSQTMLYTHLSVCSTRITHVSGCLPSAGQLMGTPLFHRSKNLLQRFPFQEEEQLL